MTSFNDSGDEREPTGKCIGPEAKKDGTILIIGILAILWGFDFILLCFWAYSSRRASREVRNLVPVEGIELEDGPTTVGDMRWHRS